MRAKVASLVFLLATSQASASGFEVARFGGDHGHAAGPTPFATYYNPAALSLTRRFELAADVIVALRSASYERTATTVATPEGAEGANLGRSDLTNVLVGPALAGSVHLGDFAVGLAALAPMAGQVKWNGNDEFRSSEDFPGARDGTARWHAISGRSLTLYLSTAVSYHVRSAGLSFGVAGNLVYNSLDLTRAATLSLDDNLAREGRIQIAGSGWVGSFAVGSLWEILRGRLWMGVSYQAPPGLYGGMVLRGTVRTNFGTVSDVAADIHQKLPDFVRFALRLRQRSYELRLSGDYARWSVFDNQCVSQPGASCRVERNGAASASVRETLISNTARNWRDAPSVRAGGTYFFPGPWEVLGGVGWDGNAIPDAMLEPTYPLGGAVNFQVGARYRWNALWALSVAYTGIYYLPRDTSGKSALDELMPPGNLPTADGRYRQYVSTLNTFVQVFFD